MVGVAGDLNVHSGAADVLQVRRAVIDQNQGEIVRKSLQERLYGFPVSRSAVVPAGDIERPVDLFNGVPQKLDARPAEEFVSVPSVAFMVSRDGKNSVF